MRLSTGPATQPDLRTCFSNSCCTGFRREHTEAGRINTKGIEENNNSQKVDRR
ncbi:hypothetical protein CRENBAI_023256 [Crenichthys baileyi]|uniref:Uncharacterized protein n=1 Tax=Crenichthys baileyi TaxID=28760 RepID=A0AAV9R6G8_9TELE